jgi:uncharacterized protein YbbC (DUF1343 family)
MKLGLEVLLADRALLSSLQHRRVALVAHPASVTHSLQHSIDALREAGVNVVSAFGPQHGMRGDKQDNMVESEDYVDPRWGIPVFSLYGRVRRPTPEMLSTFDVVLFDLQDVGCRIYTFLTTLFYVMEDCARAGKSVWVLDRPNPAGREVEGTLLRKGWESFVGGACVPMRHGLTLGEIGQWYLREKRLDLDFRVVAMEGYRPSEGPGYGWPWGERSWVNPSPNAASLNMVRCYPGTVMLEGTTLSEARGTTIPLEAMGAPGLDVPAWIAEMARLEPRWLEGCRLRPCSFLPMFQKHFGQLCEGFQIHADTLDYRPERFRPYRLQALAFKALRRLHPEYSLWREFEYEYERDRLAIDLINGSSLLREWVDDPAAFPGDFEALCAPEEAAWREASLPFLLYPSAR